MSTAPHRPRGSSLQKFQAASCIQDTAANEHIVSACKERDQTNIKQMFKIRRAGSCVQIWILYALHVRKACTLYARALRVGSLVGRAPDQDPLTACTARGWGFVLVTFVARSGFEEVRVGTKRAAVSVHSTRLPFRIVKSSSLTNVRDVRWRWRRRWRQ